MHVEMYGWCREWKEGHVDMAVCAEKHRRADGNGWCVQRGREVHVVNVWLAQKPKRHAYGQWVVGTDTHMNGLWACMVGLEIKRHAG